MHQLSAELAQDHRRRLHHEAARTGAHRLPGAATVWRRAVGQGLAELGSRRASRRRRRG